MQKKSFLKVAFLLASVSLLAAACTNSTTTSPTSIQRTSKPTVAGQSVGQTSFYYNGVQGKSAIEVLKSLHRVETKDFGKGLGEMVLSIDGVKPTAKQFWGFYVNGKPANVGASSYITKEKDLIEWRLDLINGNQ